MILVIATLASFTAGYLLRGCLAMLWERKRQRRPLSMLSNKLMRGLADLMHNQRTSAAREANLALLDELRHRDGGTVGDHRTATITARLAGNIPGISEPRTPGND